MERIEKVQKKSANERGTFPTNREIVKKTSDYGDIDEALLKRTLDTVTSLIFPPHDVDVFYHKDSNVVYIKFKTPFTYNYGNFYERFRNNQWVALQAFKKANIHVEKITVETNHHDNSGILRITNMAEHVDKYAKLPNDDLWLKTAAAYQKGKGDNNWVRIDY